MHEHVYTYPNVSQVRSTMPTAHEQREHWAPVTASGRRHFARVEHVRKSESRTPSACPLNVASGALVLMQLAAATRRIPGA